MKTATCLGRAEGGYLDAYRFLLSEPLANQSEVVVSATTPDNPVTQAMDALLSILEEIFDTKVAPEGEVGDDEVLIFDLEGRSLFDPGGTSIGIRGSLDHAKALSKYGYAVDWNGIK